MRIRRSPTHITINLAPADIKKEGSGFDLPMALGILGATARSTRKISDYVLVGELWLDGGVRGSAEHCPSPWQPEISKIKNLIVQESNAREAAVVSGVNVYP